MTCVAENAIAASAISAPQLSATLYLIPLEQGRSIVYAPLRKAAFVASSGLINFLTDLRDGIQSPRNKDEEATLEFLRRLEIIDAGPEQEPIETFFGAPEPTAMTLFLTTACNLRCTYCYASAGEHPAKFMSLDVAKRGIDFIVDNALKRNSGAIQIGYHGGGEPTVHWKVMVDSLAYARERASTHNLKLHASTATNGVLSDDKIDWIVKNLDGMSLSFDGLPSVQDKYRPTVIGQPSSGRVIYTIGRLDEAKFRYDLRVTVPANEIPRLPDSIDFIFRNFKPQAVQVEPSYQLGRWKTAPSAETESFVEAYREAKRRARGLGGDISYSAARVGTLTNHFCGISRDAFSLSPDGGVSACFEVFAEDNPLANYFFYGHSKSEGSGFDFKLPVLNNLRKKGVEGREYCTGCFARWTCAGDCYHKNLTVCGDEFSGTERCHITRELTKDQILDKIAQSGGFFWHEPASTCEMHDRFGELE